jgi:tetratricopeptide (TPR) repeat protein
MQRVVSIAAACLLAWAAGWAVWLALADAAFRAGELLRANLMAPHNPLYLAAMALQAEEEGTDPEPWLARIAAEYPTLSAPRIRLGLIAEQRGDAAAAERWLLEAFAVDRQFEPRWTLANFYLRQGRRDDFWQWLRKAFEVSSGDRTALFDLCWRAGSNLGEILERGVPPIEAVSVDLLRYVVGRGLVDAVASVAARVQSPAALLEATDFLLDHGRFGEAITTWVRAGRAPPQGVTAPRFESPQSGRGFDWRRSAADGVSTQLLDQGGLRVALSGRQAESGELLRQFVGGLRPGRYRLQWTAAGRVPPGLVWRFNGQQVSGPFKATATGGILSLHYERPRGEMRAEASFELREVRLLALE